LCIASRCQIDVAAGGDELLHNRSMPFPCSTEERRGPTLTR
jgi:hypothetical protein